MVVETRGAYVDRAMLPVSRIKTRPGEDDLESRLTSEESKVLWNLWKGTPDVTVACTDAMHNDWHNSRQVVGDGCYPVRRTCTASPVMLYWSNNGLSHSRKPEFRLVQGDQPAAGYGISHCLPP